MKSAVVTVFFYILRSF